MKMPDDYAIRAEGTAQAVPREVIANLLTRLMPRVAVATRPAEPASPTVAPSAASSPSIFRAPRTVRRRGAFEWRMDATITVTAKGHRKLRRVQDTDAWRKVEILSRCATVRDATRHGLVSADIKYALKSGTITIQEN